MKINLSYHKLIKIEKYANNSSVEVPDRCNVRDMISLLGIPKNLVPSIVVHVNDQPAWNSTFLKEGDSVKLLVLMGGG